MNDEHILISIYIFLKRLSEVSKNYVQTNEVIDRRTIVVLKRLKQVMAQHDHTINEYLDFTSKNP